MKTSTMLANFNNIVGPGIIHPIIYHHKIYYNQFCEQRNERWALRARELFLDAQLISLGTAFAAEGVLRRCISSKIANNNNHNNARGKQK